MDAETGNILVWPKLVRELKSFMRNWSRNLAGQGFLDSARRATEERDSNS